MSPLSGHRSGNSSKLQQASREGSRRKHFEEESISCILHEFSEPPRQDAAWQSRKRRDTASQSLAPETRQHGSSLGLRHARFHTVLVQHKGSRLHRRAHSIASCQSDDYTRVVGDLEARSMRGLVLALALGVNTHAFVVTTQQHSTRPALYSCTRGQNSSPGETSTQASLHIRPTDVVGKSLAQQ